MDRDDDLVFASEVGRYPLTPRCGFTARLLFDAGLRDLRFHDLCHTFGTRMIRKADIRRVQEWMGHADVQTTMKYLHYAPRGDARPVAEAPNVYGRDDRSVAKALTPAGPIDSSADGSSRC